MKQQNRLGQLNLGVKKSKKEEWYRLLSKINESERKFAAMPFWRDGVNVFAFMSILLTIIVSLSTSLLWGGRLSTRIPLFYSQNIDNWELYSQSLLFVFSMIVWIIQYTVFYLSFKLYSTDKRLAYMCNIFLIVSSVLFLITIGQIFALQLI